MAFVTSTFFRCLKTSLEKRWMSPFLEPAEEVAFLRKQMDAVDQQVSDPAQRAEFKAEIEKLINEIEAGRRRLGDAD